MLYATGKTCVCGTQFPDDRAFRVHKRKCASLFCCGRQISDIIAYRKHRKVCHLHTSDQNSALRDKIVENDNNSPPPSIHTHIPSQFTCKFCKRDNFKSARGRDYHLGFCKEFKLSQAPPALNSEPSAFSLNAELPSAIKDPTQHHSVPTRSIPEQKSKPMPNKYTSFDKLPRIKLPKSSDTQRWSHLNTTLTKQLGTRYTTHKIRTGDINQLMDSFTNSVRDILIDECGVREPKPKPKQKRPNRKKHSKLVRKLRSQKNAKYAWR